MKKRLLALLLAVLMLTTLLAACNNEPATTPGQNGGGSGTTTTGGGGGGGGSTDTTEPEEELLSITIAIGAPGRPPEEQALEALLTAFRDRGFEITFETYEPEAYQVFLTGLRADVIPSAAWEGYFENSRAGAFAPISREQIQTYMPQWYANHAEFLLASEVDGVIYAIPNCNPGLNSPYLFLRTDWFPAGKTEIVTMQDLYDYLEHSMNFNPNMVAFNLEQSQTGWQIGAKGFGAAHIMAIGPPNCTSPIVLDKRDHPNYVIRNTYEVDTYVEFLRWMRRFNEAGFLSADAMNNPTPMQQSFFAGESAIFTALNVGWTNWINSEFKANNPEPEAQIAVFDMGKADNVGVDLFSPMGNGVSIPAASADSIPKVLQFIELLYTSPEIYDLWRLGIEGVHYEILENDTIRIFDEEGRDLPAAYSPLYENHRFRRPGENDWPHFLEFEASLRERAFFNPFAQFFFDATVSPRMEAIASNINDINGEFLPQIYLGMHADVDAALADLTRRLNDAGLDEWVAEMLRQANEFIDARGLDVTIVDGRN